MAQAAKVCLDYLIEYSNDKLISNITSGDPTFNYKFSRTKFYNSIQGIKVSFLTRKNIDDIKQAIKLGQQPDANGDPNTSTQRLLKKYELMLDESSGEDMLITKQSSSLFPARSLVSIEDLFDIITDAHIRLKHHNKNTRDCIKVKYLIPDQILDIMFDSCNICYIQKMCAPKSSTQSLKKTHPSHPIKKTSTNSNNFENSENINKFNYQVYLGFVNMRGKSDNGFKSLMYYVDLNTTYILLRPLSLWEDGKEVASELFQIFLDFGSPSRIIVENMKTVCAALKIINDTWAIFNVKIVKNSGQTPIKPEQVLNLIEDWMNENKSNSWAVGCRLVQYKLNSMIDNGCSPYKSLFKFEPHHKPTENNEIEKNIGSKTLVNKEMETDLKNIIPLKLPVVGQIVNKPEETTRPDVEFHEISASNGTIINTKIEIQDNFSNEQNDSIHYNEVDHLNDGQTTCHVCKQRMDKSYTCHGCFKNVHILCSQRLVDFKSPAEVGIPLLKIICRICNERKFD